MRCPLLRMLSGLFEFADAVVNEPRMFEFAGEALRADTNFVYMAVLKETSMDMQISFFVALHIQC